MDVKALIRSLEACPIGDGDLYGEPFSCLPYQRKFLRGAFAPGVLRAGLSLARGGGKTGLSSGLCLDAIRPEGTLHKPGFEAVLIASSFDQARIGFEAVLNSLELMGERDDYRVLNQTNVAMLQHKRTKARLRVAGSDNRRAQGWRFNLCVGDEGAQWGPRGELLAAAIRTALGKRKDARFIAIGTRPATDSHWFARLLAEDDPAVFALSYAATADDNPFAVKTWRKANPALSYGMPSLEVLKAEARLARRDPAELATFRSMRLNMGTAEVELPTYGEGQAVAELCARGVLSGFSVEMAVSSDAWEGRSRLVQKASLVGLALVDTPGHDGAVLDLERRFAELQPAPGVAPSRGVRYWL